MSGKDSLAGGRGRHDRLLKEHVHDPYMHRRKPAEPTVCPDCAAVFSGGRWHWEANRPAGAAERLCPACERIRDRVPAGMLRLEGPFFQAHRDEVLALLRSKTERERASHPLKRVIDIVEQDDGATMVSFTDDHLPRGVGEAIHRAYEGELEVQYTEESGLVRARWRR